MTQVPGVNVLANAGSVAVVTTAETVLAQTRATSSPYPGCIFKVEFDVQFTTGTGVTGLTYRIRRDSLTGSAIYTSSVIAAAASTILAPHHIAWIDQLTSDVSGQIWVLTVVQAGATGNGSGALALGTVSQVG